MNKFEFLSYTPTPTEKYQGIATIKIYGRIVVRYKIVPTKDGSATFPAAPSLKIEDKYYPSFELDSNSESRELQDFIKDSMKKANTQQPMYQPSLPNLDSCPF